MGKGDKKTTRGKIVMGSYGKKRPGKNGARKKVETKESE
ncbi:ribosomal small subunit protein bTHX [Sphingobacterium alimentarium]|jgi:30S ribosomal protein S31|uniref:Ribosomal small subunit protein bTHX n=1 Tax=Sphingobacterium alimentarium TaxID=797292 RepID=A0A4R3VVV2_9SPHI|nr:30S ribosomal protein THX [Sphingobacterium alimentarium]TCV09850.1 ribosomal small subunit protein bTHX [Sphingobacterium alimentarium]